MGSEYYSGTTVWVIAIDIIIAIGMLSLFRIGKAGNLKTSMAAIAFAVYIAFMHWVFAGQNLFPANLDGGIFYAIILIGAGFGVLLFHLTSRAVFDNLSQVPLQLVQGLRVFVGAGFLMEGVVNVIPGWFSIMDGFLHITSGYLALVAAVALLLKHATSRKLLWLANLVGLLDIIIIVTGICFLAWESLGPHHNMNYVVFFAGPVFLWLHFVSIKKLIP